jgi:RNA polymerase sigma-70 factor (ECF subfamily)
VPTDSSRPAFNALWDRQHSGLARLAAVLFDDPRLRPAPSPEELLRPIRPRAAAIWTERGPDGDAGAWLRRFVTGELLGHGLVLYDAELHGLLRRQVWSDSDVEELVQGAAARAAERLTELVDRPRPLFTWLCQLVRQQRADWLRFRSARKRDARRTRSLDADPRLADTGTTPTQAERRTRVREMFERVLARLPAEYTEVLRLSIDEHLGPAEIATRLGLSPEAARVRLFRARRRALEVWVREVPDAASDLVELGVIDAAVLAEILNP